MNLLSRIDQLAARIQPPDCSSSNCKSTQWARWHRRGDGVHLNDSWYCGKRCLENALSAHLTQPLSLRSLSSGSIYRLPLGLLLLSRGVIDQHHLAAALNRKREAPAKRIGECLKEFGAVDDVQLTRALGAQNCLPVLLARSPTLDLSVPLALQEASDALCFRGHTGSNTIYIGFGVKPDLPLLSAIEAMLRVRVEACILSLSLITSRFEAARLAPPSNAVLFDNLTTLDIVSCISSYACQTHSDSIRVVTTNRFVWARINSVHDYLDLLFRLQPN